MLLKVEEQKTDLPLLFAIYPAASFQIVELKLGMPMFDLEG